MRYFTELSYNGKAYHGWQIQPNAVTIQEVLESALSTLLKENIAVVGAGRTDTGVHAKQMYAHFDCTARIDSTALCYKLNALLPRDIAVKAIFRVKHDAHARFDAISRQYEYKISTVKNVFNFDTSYTVQLPLSLSAMQEACDILLNYRDFQCFSKRHTDVKTFNCDIMEASWSSADEVLTFSIKADRFLRNMVRAIVGTMINIGLGKLEPQDLHEIIRSKDRAKAGFSVPAQGLFLKEIIYPDHLKLN